MSHFLYRHIRLDKNEPFYIGVGKIVEDGTTVNRMYKRAYEKQKRNILWERIVSKTPYDVEILLEDDDIDFIHKKEIEFIQLYGRIDLGTGTLSNLREGGKDGINRSRQSIEKGEQTIRMTGYDKVKIERLRKYREINPEILKNGQKDFFIYNIDGVFIEKSKNIRDVARKLGVGECSYIYKSIKNKESYYGKFYTYEYQGEKLDLKLYKAKPLHKYKVYQVDNSNNIVNTYSSVKEASILTKTSKSSLLIALKSGKICKSYYWVKEGGNQ